MIVIITTDRKREVATALYEKEREGVEKKRKKSFGFTEQRRGGGRA